MSIKKIRPSGIFAGRSVLVVDGDPVSRRELEKLLTELGFESVVTAIDGSHALRHLDKSRFHLILTDIDMKPMSGFEFASTLRSSAPTRYDTKTALTPIVFISSSSSRSQIQRAKEINAKGYIIKPVAPDTLRGRLERVFQG